MKPLVYILLMLTVASSFGQPTPQPTTVSVAWRASFLAPGIINEIRLGNRTTLVSQVRMTSYSLVKEVKTDAEHSTLYSSSTINPVLSVGGRHYYNFERRLEKGKSIRSNSGNYLSVQTFYRFPAVAKKESAYVPIGDGAGFGAEVLWGFQRTYKRNFYLNLSLGTRLFRGTVEGAGDFTIGYTFPSN